MRGSFLHESTRITARLLRAALACLPFAARPAWAAGEAAQKAVTEPVLDLAGTTSLALTLLKVFGALLLTVGLMLLLAAWLRKLGLGRAGLRQGALISIIDTRMIAPKKYITVVQVANETLALGITDQQITLLTRLETCPPAKTEEERKDQPQRASFAALLGKAGRRVAP